MTKKYKHDTWAELKPDSPFDPIIDLFPEGFPMRDPFPMTAAYPEPDKEILLIAIDIERLDDEQLTALSELMSEHWNKPAEELKALALEQGNLKPVFWIDYELIKSVKGGPESFKRSKEFNDFQPTSEEEMRDFLDDQYARWIEGDEVPPPINSIEDIPEELRHPEIETYLEQQKINQMLQAGNYSVFDVLSGRAMVEVLNQLDPDNEYSLYSEDDDECY